MRIKAIRIRNVKKIGAEGLVLENIGDGLNVLSEPNEFGKSTIFEAFRHGLLTKHSSKTPTIKALQPRHTSESPLIEIDIDVDGSAYRIRKQFLSQAGTTITDLKTYQIIKSADDAQEWIKKAIGADARNAGPTGLLWVTQGESINSAAQDENQKEVFSSVLDNEVSTVLSGKRGRDVLSKVNAELVQLITKTTRQPTKQYKAAVIARKQLEAQKVALSDKMQQAEKALNRLSDIRTQEALLIDLERDKELENQLKKADDNHQDALQAAPKLSELEARKDAKHAALENLLDKKSGLISDINTGRETSAALATYSGELAKLEETLGLNEADYLDVQNARKRIQHIYDATNAATRAAYDNKNAYEARAVLPNLNRKLGEAEKARKDIEGLEAKFANMRVDENVLERLTHLSQSIELINTKRDAGRTKMSIQYEDEPAIRLKLNGDDVSQDQTHIVSRTLIIDVPGTAKIRIETPTQKGEGVLNQELDQAVSDFNRALAEYGVKDLKGAKIAGVDRYQIKERIREAKITLTQNAPDGLTALKSNIETKEQQVSQLDESALDIEAATLAEDTAKADLIRVTAKVETVLTNLQAVRTKVSTDKAQRDSLNRALATLCDRIGAIDHWEDLEAQILKQVEAARIELQDARETYEECKKTAPNLEAAKASLERARQAIANRKQKFQDLNLEREGLKGRLQTLQAEGVAEELSRVRGKIRGAEASIEQFEDEVRALTLLKETLEGQQDREKTKLFTPVVNELKPLISQVIPGTEIHLGDDFAADEIIRNGVREEVKTLSGGTQEQIAILTRLAFARLKARQGHPTPVILDDAIVFSDDGRITDMFTALNMVAADLQILVLTCRQKSFEGLGGNLLSAKNWDEGG